MAVRTPAKGEAAKQKILRATGRDESSIEVWKLDMDSYDSVKEFSARVSSALPRVDAVLANAGVAFDSFQLSEENEKNVNVNVVSTFLLLLLLLPKLRESANIFNITPRFTIVNSALHYVAPLKELDPDHGSEIFARLNNPSTSNMGAATHSPSYLSSTLSASLRNAPRGKSPSSSSTRRILASASQGLLTTRQVQTAPECGFSRS